MSPRSKEQNAIIKDERREQLMLAALKVFAHKGLAATKIGDIAAAAGLSHGLVYHYFDSKDAIFIELVRRAISGAAGMVEQIGRIPMDPLDKVRMMAEMTLKAIDEQEESAYYFYLMEQAFASDAGPEEAKAIMSGFNAPTEVMIRTVIEGQAMGRIREGDPMDYASFFWASVQGLATYKVVAGKQFHMPDPDFLVRVFVKNG